jgi:16S rRNA (guanine966-N2)-methyltransferase
MIERERAAFDALLHNRDLLGASDVEIQRADALNWLAAHPETFDLIFVDPPFDSEQAERTLALLAPHLKPSGQVYVEKRGFVDAPQGFAIHRSGRAGQSHFALLIKET